MKIRLAALALPLLLLLPRFAVSEDSDAACKKVEALEPPAKDLPTKAEKAKLSGCDSEALYYGIDEDQDPVKARKCAFLELNRGEGNAFGGEALLMMIYANGKGVPRNFDLATKFACELDGAPAELEGRLEHIAKMKAGTDKGELDVCDDVTSGMMEGMCAGHAERIASVAREERVGKVAGMLPKAELAKLDDAAKAFFDSRSDVEVDQSGTGRNAFVTEERAKLEDGLVDALELLAKKSPPAAKAEDFKAADAELNKAYSSIMKKKDFEYGTVTRDGIRDTQRLWIPYRDAFVALAAKAEPAVPADAWRAWLTKQRIEMLRDFADN